MGFISGHNIFDNILAFKLGQDHTRCTNQEGYLFKVDNKKAYNRVLHNILWDVIAAIGFDQMLIMFIKGLVSNATSKVHVNGMFTREVDL